MSVPMRGCGCGSLTNSMPIIDHRHQLELQSAQEDDSFDIIVVDSLQFPSIIPNYSYILSQGTYLAARDITAYLRILRSWDSSYLYLGTKLF
jgi:hypothetical protein